MLWHEKTWTRISAIDKRIPVLIPLGSCEQHGPHLPLFVDTLQVSTIADKAEKKLADRVLLLPTLWLGSSHHHMDFPGTISLLPSLYSQVIQSLATCVLEAGFRRLFFLNGHGGNQTPVSQALSELVCANDLADDAYLVLSTWWDLGKGKLDEGMKTREISHACEYETSLMMAIRPDLVSMDRISEGPMALDNEWIKTENLAAGRVSLFRRFRRLTASGSMGLPSAASPEKGRNILEVITQEVVHFVTDFAGWPDLPPIGPRD